MPAWLNQLLPILVLLSAIFIVLRRLPRVDLGHSDAFKRRRFLNWFPLGLTYAMLYMGRYNFSATVVTLDQLGLVNKQEFGSVDGWGSLVYGVAFIVNGPLTDRWGGRATILISAIGSALMNALMGVLIWRAQTGGLTDHDTIVSTLTLLFSANMYFQSFGAVSIVKVNAPWFHVRERGVLGGVFGILISLGLYFSYDWSRLIAKHLPIWWVFLIPAAILLCFAAVDAFVIRDSPKDAGFQDFNTADASSGDDGRQLGLMEVARRMFSQRVILIIVAIEFCSGFLRNAIMKWYLVYADKLGFKSGFVASNWGVLLCVAGIMGGMFAGVISDHVFDSRRGPVATVLYAGMIVGALVVAMTLGTQFVGLTVVFMSLCVIGVHGMLSGTASMDFGGRKNAGVATGIIDGFVYLGTAAQSFLYGRILPSGEDAKVVDNWRGWPLAMLPLALVGFALATRVWRAKPQPKPVVETARVAVAPARVRADSNVG